MAGLPKSNPAFLLNRSTIFIRESMNSIREKMVIKRSSEKKSSESNSRTAEAKQFGFLFIGRHYFQVKA
jgi:hypothetical protein